MTSPAETYIFNLIQPLVDECKFSINSTKEFSNHFKKIQFKLDSNLHEICSWDIKSMYSNININRVVSYIIDKIYVDPKKFFTDVELNDKTGETKPLIIPKTVFQKFLISILTEFSGFSALSGYYKQKSGLSMGGKLSSPLSNIYMHMLESDVINEHILNGDILYYCRYVDDTLILTKKGSKNSIFEKMNKFDKNLIFTEEPMKNNELKFLDTCLYLDSSKTFK